MDAQELRNLQEAYNQVHQVDEELDDNTKKRAIRHIKDTKKLLRTMAREVDHNFYPEPEGYEPESEKKIKKKTQREQVDLYDIILSHLLDEGYAETVDAAEAMMVNMSEEWRDSIMEGYKRYPAKKVGNKLDRMYDDPNTDTRFGKTGKRYSQMRTVDSHMKGEVHSLIRAHSPKKSKAKETENRKRGENG